jgi:hypothetical protein
MADFIENLIAQIHCYLFANSIALNKCTTAVLYPALAKVDLVPSVFAICDYLVCIS